MGRPSLPASQGPSPADTWLSDFCMQTQEGVDSCCLVPPGL